MRYVYSLVRFVPDPARGEFMNVGAIAGSEESSDWAVRQVGNVRRAQAFGQNDALSMVWSFMEWVGDTIEEYQSSFESLFEPHEDIDEEWLERLYEDRRHVVQLSPPALMVAHTAEQALDRVFELMIYDRSEPRKRYQKKTEALAALRKAFIYHTLKKNRDYRERVVLAADRHRERFDFVISNGRALQLTHSWSFQNPNQERLSSQIKSWGWTVRKTREVGGRVDLPDDSLEVASDVAVEVVYIPPSQGQDTRVLAEAQDVFSALDVRAVPLESAPSVAVRARKLLRTASGTAIEMFPD